MEPHKIVSHDAWIAARKAHLAEEKAFSKARDALSKKRRELPWEKVEKNYVFEGPNGKEIEILITQTVQKDIAKNGPISQGIQSQYGLNRSAGVASR